MSQSGKYATAISPVPPVSAVAFGQVYNKSALTINSGTNVTFDSNATLVNITHIAGTDTITIGSTGTYLIQFTLSTQGDIQAVILKQNGVALSNIEYTYNAGTQQVNGEGIANLNSGDSVTVTLITYSGTPIIFWDDASYVNASLTFEKLSLGGGSLGASSFVTNAGTANQAGGVLNIVGGAGITTAANPPGNTVEISLTGTGAIETITGNDAVAESPIANNFNIVTAHSTAKFAGSAATETLDFGLTNLVLGSSLPSLAGGVHNAGFGDIALGGITSGSGNAAVGYAALSGITTGSNNTAIGFDAGLNYTGAESGNILISNTGTLGESNTIRIGTGGTQTSCFIAGIDGVNVASTANVVTESGNQLGTATITAGAGIVVTTAANIITIATAGAGLSWSVITINQTASIDNGYFCNKAGTLQLALPTISAVGDTFEVVNISQATGTQITQAAGQEIFIGSGSTTLGVGGSLQSSALGDSLRLVCRGANTTWQVVSMIGNWTII